MNHAEIIANTLKVSTSAVKQFHSRGYTVHGDRLYAHIPQLQNLGYVIHEAEVPNKLYVEVTYQVVIQGCGDEPMFVGNTKKECHQYMMSISEEYTDDMWHHYSIGDTDYACKSYTYRKVTN